MNERILIVDDDPDALTLIGLTLERRGYSVFKAGGGSEALTMIDSNHPDLVLLDLMMPHMDGYEVCRRIKSDPRLLDIPIVMLTAKAQMASQVEGYRVGADDYVTKPVHPDDLAAHIHAVLERAQERRSRRAGARVVAVIGVKGGVGTTTIAVNIATVMAASRRAILADFDPAGTASIYLGLGNSSGMADLLSRDMDTLDREAVTRALMTHISGLRVLSASGSTPSIDHTIAILARLLDLCDICVIDMGGGLGDTARALLSKCDRVLMAIDSDRAAVLQTQRMLLALTELGVSRSRLQLVWANRSGLEIRAAMNTIRAALGDEPIPVVDAAAGAAYQAVESGTPLVLHAPDSPASAALRELAESVALAVSVESTPQS